jgi:hypothetical protein
MCTKKIVNKKTYFNGGILPSYPAAALESTTGISSYGDMVLSGSFPDRFAEDMT